MKLSPTTHQLKKLLLETKRNNDDVWKCLLELVYQVQLQNQRIEEIERIMANIDRKNNQPHVVEERELR